MNLFINVDWKASTEKYIFYELIFKKKGGGIEEYFEVIETRHEENFWDDEKLYVMIEAFYMYTHVLWLYTYSIDIYHVP